MKKNVELKEFENAKIKYGTINKVDFNSIFIEISSWTIPKEIEYENLTRKLKHLIKKEIYSKIIEQNIFMDRFICDLDLRTSGMLINEKSFTRIYLNLYIKNKDILYDDEILHNNIKYIISDLYNNVIKHNEYFSFHKRK